MDTLSQDACLSFKSDIDYSEAKNILDLTTIKQKLLRRQRQQPLHTQLLLKRTYTHVCQLMNTDCAMEKPLPLATVDTNKRKFLSDSNEMQSKAKKSKDAVNYDILKFLHELNTVKILPRY